jgi:hypothetical protein
VRARVPPLSGRGLSVKQDWRAWLPEDKSKVFRSYAKDLESSYSMFSVSLNEVIELRQNGCLAKSCQAVCVTPALCARLTDLLTSILRALGDHAKHYGTVPNAAPLDPANFQGAKGQRSARMSGLLSNVLLSQRWQFLHKITTLQEMVEDLREEFRATADELSEGTSTAPAILWETVDADHYDLNTCLRETVILLKSFLLVLPEDELTCFQETVSMQMRAAVSLTPVRQRILRRRRMASLERE